jgi:6,7-dimethyl-8-ribityllumazine synthase
MLTPVKKQKSKGAPATFAIVASRYNAKYVDAMVRAATAELKAGGARAVRVFRVPGAYEIPLVAARLARTSAGKSPRPVSAIICVGVILRGETVHAALIGDAVSRALMEIQVRHELPVIHEVLLLENEQQARARCLAHHHNRGREAAQTALAMAALMSKLWRRRPVPAVS